MAFTAEKPPKPTLRERLVTTKLDQVQRALAVKTDELQVELRYGLSPAKIDQRQFELDALRDLQVNLRNQLELIGEQSVRGPATGLHQDDDDVLIGPWRSQRAYLENLQRERVKLAPLSRQQYEVAKELSAKRSRRGRPVDLTSDDVNRSEHPSWYTQNNRVRSYLYAKETLTGYDPCIEQKKVRRQVMFAQRSAGIGYRVRHEWKPC